MEENGGGDGNSSVAELEVMVETLEGTSADHEIRISAAEIDLTGSYSHCLSPPPLPHPLTPTARNVFQFHAVFRKIYLNQTLLRGILDPPLILHVTFEVNCRLLLI